MKFDMAKVVHSVCEANETQKPSVRCGFDEHTSRKHLFKKSNHVNESSYDDVKERSRGHDTQRLSSSSSSSSIKIFMNEMLDFALHNPTSSSSL